MTSEHRSKYRKNLRVTGYLVREDGEKQFHTQNISLSGLRAHFDDYQGLYKDILVHTFLPALKLEGYLLPVWEMPAEDNGYDIGFKFFSLTGVEGNSYRYRACEQAGNHAQID